MQSFISRTNFGGAKTIGYFWITRKLPQKWRKRGSIIKWEIWDKNISMWPPKLHVYFLSFLFKPKIKSDLQGDIT